MERRGLRQQEVAEADSQRRRLQDSNPFATTPVAAERVGGPKTERYPRKSIANSRVENWPNRSHFGMTIGVYVESGTTKQKVIRSSFSNLVEVVLPPIMYLIDTPVSKAGVLIYSHNHCGR